MSECLEGSGHHQGRIALRAMRSSVRRRRKRTFRHESLMTQ
jgi:hypothetical protein